jgi:hypothetical protein
MFKKKIIFDFRYLWLQKKVGKNIFPPLPFCCYCWIRDLGSEIQDPGLIKIRIQDKHPGCATLKVIIINNYPRSEWHIFSEMTLEMAEGDACQPADQIEDIEDMMGGGGGGEDSLLLPRERFNNRREVTLRPKKRSRKSEIVASEGLETNGVEDLQVFHDAVCSKIGFF